jgi:hypothetical protein
MFCPKRDLVREKRAGESPAKIVFSPNAFYLARMEPFLAGWDFVCFSII